ncbi:MAG: IS200/IS605 family transposase [Bifidobacterium longum]|nr:IS200/IS605 family transposase [Bifidobacterium longum]
MFVESAEFNGETDHVHLLVSFPPTVELSRLVNSLKGVSSRYLRRDYPELARHYWRAQRLWSPSYYAGTAGGAPLDTLKRYIENQNRPA